MKTEVCLYFIILSRYNQFCGREGKESQEQGSRGDAFMLLSSNAGLQNTKRSVLFSL